MRNEHLLTRLSEECRTTRGKAEDFLLALADLCVDALDREQRFALPGIGSILINPRRRGGPHLEFHAAEKLKERLELPDRYDPQGAVCPACKQRERQRGRRLCRKCRREKRKAG